jgi:hypothetical protein
MEQKQSTTELEISLPMLIGIIITIGALIYAAVYFFGPKQDTDKKQPETIEESLAAVKDVSLTDIELVGDENAKYVFLTISDFECPLCRNFELGSASAPSTADQIKKAYVDTGLIRTGFVPYIIRPEHKPAALNENIGYFCARDQGKGMLFARAIFSNSKTNGYGIDAKGSERTAMIDLAVTSGLNQQEFTDCYDKRDIVRSDAISQKVNTQIRVPWIAEKGEWFGTPTLVICKINENNAQLCDGKAFVGAYPFEDIKSAIDAFIAD